MRVLVLTWLVCVASATGVTEAAAQDLEPRAYSASPVGLNVLVAGTGRSSGGVLVDPSLPLEDVNATIGALTVGAGRTFSLFGRTALALGAVSLVRMKATGRVEENAGSVSRTGLADPRLKLSVNLLGGRALTASEFAGAARPTIVGVSLTVGPPLGQYESTKLINIGAHRWSFKPEIGISHAIHQWTLDGYAGAWWFTTNDEFFPGASVRTQKPIATIQAHVSYTFKPRLWVAMDGTWYAGGTTSINGVENADLQRNSRIGATASFPLTKQQSVKVAASTGATTRIGADFRTLSAGWQLAWLDK